MLKQHDLHLLREHPIHLCRDWGLFAVLGSSAVIIGALELLQPTMPFLTLPAIF